MTPIGYDLSEYKEFTYDLKILFELQGYKFASLLDLCQFVLKESELAAQFKKLSFRLKAHINSYKQCRISLANYDIEDLLPVSLWLQFQQTRDKVFHALLEHVHDLVLSFYQNFFWHKLSMLQDIADDNGIRFAYSSSKHGRLSVIPGRNQVNPYNLPKDKRNLWPVQTGFMVAQFDIKSAQPRIAIHISEDERLKVEAAKHRDLYVMFAGDREQVKRNLFRWMFNANQDNDRLFAAIAPAVKACRQKLYQQLVHDGYVQTPFGRPLFFCGQAENVLYQNFLTSYEADLLNVLTCKVQERLYGLKSRILFPFYDAIVCEIEETETWLVPEIQRIMETSLFYLPVEVKVGKDWKEAS